MILLTAVVIGLLAGLLFAATRGFRLMAPNLCRTWLVIASFVLHLLAFNLPATRIYIPGQVTALFLMISQWLLLAFAWANRRLPGFLMLGIGLGFNMMVITANGGLMPISPITVRAIALHAAKASWQVGHRLGSSKDIVLIASQTRLQWLSDSLLLPAWILYRVAFSIGDVVVVMGAFWALLAAVSQIMQTNCQAPEVLKW